VPRLSIIIPVAGNLRWLEDTLLSVLENRPDDCEVLVVLDEPYDDPYELEGEVRFVETSPGSGLVESLNRGINASRSPIVHLLVCGCQVHEGWADTAAAHFADPRVATVAPLILKPGEPERIVAAGMTYGDGGTVVALGQGKPPAAVARCRSRLVAASCLAAFYRKSALELVGLFSHDVDDWLASTDLGLALEQAGYRTVLEPDCRIVAAHPGLPHRQTAFRRAKELERLYWRWGPRGGWPRSLMLHGIHLAAESVQGLLTLQLPSQWAGRLAGLGGIGAHRRQYERLRQLRQLSPAPAPSLTVPHFLRETVPSSSSGSGSRNGTKSA